jgi:hypothetical protein
MSLHVMRHFRFVNYYLLKLLDDLCGEFVNKIWNVIGLYSSLGGKSEFKNV